MGWIVSLVLWLVCSVFAFRKCMITRLQRNGSYVQWTVGSGIPSRTPQFGGQWVVVTQLCLILCDPVDWTLPGSSVHGILWARILEWVVMPSSRGSSQPGDRTQVSRIAGRLFTVWATQEAPKCSSSGTMMLNVKNSAFCSHFLNIHNLLQLLENKVFSRLPCEGQKNGHQKKPLKGTVIIVIVLLIVNIYQACTGTRHWDKSFSIIAKWNSIATPSCSYCG